MTIGVFTLRPLIRHVRSLCRPGETAEECRDRLREENREAIERACAETLAYERALEEAEGPGE